jgi:arylsulfatase A-like enzyme
MRWLSTWSGSAPLTAEQTRKMRRYYYGYCAFVDAQFERLIDWMQSNGFLDNTIIAFVSDHGTHLCDHGLVQKNTFYEPSVSVPYFFRYPGHIASGRIFSTPVETLSLLPTALELAGLHVPTCLADSSLAKSIRGGTEPPARPVFSGIAHRDWSGFCGCPPARPVFSDLNHAFDPRHPDKRLVMVRDGNWKLTACVDDLESRGELVNLADDPFEQRNLFGAPEFQSVQDRLWVLIRDHVSGTPRPCANVRLLGALPRGDAGDVLCPLCRRDMVQRVDGIPDWSDDLTAAYQCSYCGTRFGTKP